MCVLKVIPLDSPVTEYLRQSFLNCDSGENMGIDDQQLDEIKKLLAPRCSSTTINEEEMNYIDEADILKEDEDEEKSVHIYPLSTKGKNYV